MLGCSGIKEVYSVLGVHSRPMCMRQFCCLSKNVRRVRSIVTHTLPAFSSQSTDKCILNCDNMNYIAVPRTSESLYTSHTHLQRRFQTTCAPITTYHTRPLPNHLIALSSSEGKKLFREALSQGGLESFFPLSEQFITQSDPSFCSISTMAMTLNALKYDPKKVWKGAWRWVSEETLLCDTTKICGHNLENIKTNGLNFLEFEALGNCHGISIRSIQILPQICNQRDDKSSHQPHCAYSLEFFRDIVEKTSTSSKADTFIVVNFSRKHLGQTGDGHFSPIGGYHKAKDLVLIMDVARFKYPPFWVSIKELWDSMALIDTKTLMPRGYFILSSTKALSDCSSTINLSQDDNNIHNDHHDHNHCHNHSHTHNHQHSKNIIKYNCTCAK